MRHQKHGRKFGRKSGPRHALFASLVDALLTHEHIRTTDAKAKEIRRIAEKAITWATSVGKIVEANQSGKADAEDKARVVHAMRMAGRVVKQKATLKKLFSEIGPRFVGRPGGYTRVLKIGNRHGDAAPMSIIELVERGQKAAPEPVEAEAKSAAPKKTKAPKAENADAPKAKKATKKKDQE